MFYYIVKPHSSPAMNFNFLIFEHFNAYTDRFGSIIASHAKTECYDALFQI